MKIQGKSQVLWLLVSVAAIAAAVFLGIRYGPGSGAGSLFARLPMQAATVGQVDVQTIRDAGLVAAGSSAAMREPEYEAFIKKSGFNWERDLDRLSWSFTPSGKFFIAEGRFDWERLEAFVAQEGGSCRNGYCTVRGSQPGREISFFSPQSGVMALAVSADRYAADQLRESHPVSFTPPAAPLWVHFSKEALTGSEPESPGLRGFARVLRETTEATLMLQPEGDEFALRLEAECDSPATAARMAGDLNKLTSWLRQLLKIENAAPDETEFASLLAKGDFSSKEGQLQGHWPVSKAFLGAVLLEP